MKLNGTFPLMFCLNLAKRQDRRVRCEEVFEEIGLAVRRFPAVNTVFVRRTRSFESAGRYAHAVSTRMILRKARQMRAPAVFIFEDDVVLAPDLRERLAEIELPEDWGLFDLGCQHFERPEVVVPGLLRVNGALDTHAWGIRASHYGIVMKALEGRIDPPRGALPPADVFLARLHARVPSYAAFPNLAWQAEEHSDLVYGVFSNYRSDGTQKTAAPSLAGVLAEALGGSRWSGLPGEEPEPFYIGRYYGRRAQWVGLDREAAELVVEHDFTAHFANVFAPDECYFGTVLAAKGYPMDERVVGRDLTWTRWAGAPARHPETIATVTPELGAELLASGCFFARKFGAGIGAGAHWLPQALGLPSQASGSPLP